MPQPRVVSDSLATLMAMMDSGVLPPPVVTHQYPWRHAMDAVQVPAAPDPALCSLPRIGAHAHEHSEPNEHMLIC